MRYKVTAIKPVEILVKTRHDETQRSRAGHGARAVPGFEWIYMNAGEVRDGLDWVLGVMASYAPGEPAQPRLGRDAVLLPLNAKLPQVYYGLFELEHSTVPD